MCFANGRDETFFLDISIKPQGRLLLALLSIIMLTDKITRKAVKKHSDLYHYIQPELETEISIKQRKFKRRFWKKNGVKKTPAAVVMPCTERKIQLQNTELE